MMDISNQEIKKNDTLVDQLIDPNVYPDLPSMLTSSETEWNYSMRRSMQEIIPGLFIGPYNSACKSKLQELQTAGITHIICVRQQSEANFIRPNFPDIFKYLVLTIADTPTENIIQHFKPVKTFIDEALQTNGRVLIHGNAGISRCAALLLGYLMETYGINHSKAFTLAQKKRFCINPSDTFMSQLKEYEPIYRARNTQNGQVSDTNQRSKRTLQEIDIDERNFDEKVTLGS